MEKYNNWKLKFYTIWAGQAVSLITSAILQMAIIFYLTLIPQHFDLTLFISS